MHHKEQHKSTHFLERAYFRGNTYPCELKMNFNATFYTMLFFRNGDTKVGHTRL